METINTEKPIQIPEEFPYKINEKDLREKVEELAWGIVKTSNISASHKYSAIAQIGLIEMGNRSNEKNSRFSKRTTLFSLSFSIVAISFSFIAVYYANKDDKADTIWQKNQLDSYNQMTNELKVLNKQVDSLNILIKTNTNALKLNGK